MIIGVTMFKLCLGLGLVILSSGVSDSQPLWYIPAIALPGLVLMFFGAIESNGE